MEGPNKDWHIAQCFKPASALAMVLFIALPSAASADRMDELITLWRKPDYPTVVPQLFDYRKQPYGRNLQTDYMIATALCRLPDNVELGQKYFQRIIAAYQLSKENRRQVEREQSLCATATSSTTQPELVIASLGHSDIGVRGKTFYWIDHENAPLGGDPIHIKRDLTAAELAARHYSPEQRDDAVKSVQQLLGLTFKVMATERFVLASSSGQSNSELRTIGDYLEHTMRFYHQEYDIPLPEYLVTVYLAPESSLFVRMAEKVHGLKISSQSIGYSYRDDYSLAALVTGPNAGTLKHELFHLMVRNHFGDIPPWMDEGMAALYEVSRRNGDRVDGLENWRGDVLRRFWDMRPSLSDLVGMDWKKFDAENESMEKQAVNHATARYFALYLQQKKQLPEVFKAMQQQTVEQLTGNTRADNINLLTGVLGRSMTDVDRDFIEWFQQDVFYKSGQGIASAQRMLNKLGYQAGNADGMMGKNTRNALRAFQSEQGMSASGELDKSTYKRLREKTGSN